MSYFSIGKTNNVFRPTKKTISPSSTLTEPSLNISFFPGISGGTTASGITVTQQTALQHPTLIACVNMISNDISKLPLDIKSKDQEGWKVDTTYYLNDVFCAPNRRFTMIATLQKVVKNYLLSGNGYLVVIRNPDGSVDQLIPVDNWDVTCSEQNDGSRLYYVTSKLLCGLRSSFKSDGLENSQRRILEEDMIHLMNSFSSYSYGSSPVQNSSETIGLGLASQEAAARSFNNGTHLNGILKLSAPANQSAMDRIADEWARTQADVTNTGKTPVIPSGVEYVPITVTPAELQLVEARDQASKDIARMYGVPLSKLGYADTEKASNLEEQERSYISNTLEPICNELCQQFVHKLLFSTDFRKYKFAFDFSSMTLADQKERYQTYAIAITNGILSRDEVRALEGYAPIPSGQGQEFLTPTYTANHTGDGAFNTGPKK